MNDKASNRRRTISRLRNEMERVKALLDAYPNSEQTLRRQERLEQIKSQLLELGALNNE